MTSSRRSEGANLFREDINTIVRQYYPTLDLECKAQVDFREWTRRRFPPK